MILTDEELILQVDNDPQATDRERDPAAYEEARRQLVELIVGSRSTP